MSKIDTFLTDYEKVSVKMLGSGSVQADVIESLGSLFDDFGLDIEGKTKVLSELLVQTAVSYNKDAISAVMEVLKLDLDELLKTEQINLLTRQKQGYDDNMLLKVVEHQASLASFAVNAGSDSAQTTIDSLKAKMLAVEERVVAIDGTDSCPVVIATTPVPSGFSITNVADESLSLSWNSVTNATSYLLYRDGTLIATQGALTFVDTGLTPETKYAYTVKASISGIDSNYSSVLIGTTLEEVV